MQTPHSYELNTPAYVTEVVFSAPRLERRVRPSGLEQIVYFSTGEDITILGLGRSATTQGASVLEEILPTWGAYCEDLFRELARRAPNELAELIRGGKLKPPRLTYAAEIFGAAAPDGAFARRVLEPLLEDPSPIVREGAVYGIAHHLRLPEVRAALARVATSDNSRAVRTAAREALDE